MNGMQSSDRGRRAGILAFVATLALSGCGGGADKANVKPGDSSTTYEAPPPPVMQEGKTPVAGKRGSMSARELRDFRKKQQGQP